MNPRQSSTHNLLSSVIGRFGIPCFLVIVVAIFSALKPSSFATIDNFRAILDNQVIVVLLAFAVMLPLIVGEFDLSPAANLSLAMVVVLGLSGRQHIPPLLATALALGIATFNGALLGLIVSKLRVPAFVASLAMTSLMSGAWLWYMHGEALVERQPASFTVLARGNLAGIPLPVLDMAAIAAILSFVLTSLPVGRRMYAVGGNRQAAHLTGIQTEKYVVGSFMVGGLLAGISGVLLAARLGAATGGDGVGLLLPAFTGAFLGATTIRPGRFNVLGTVVSVYALAVMISGLQQLGTAPWVEPAFDGATLIVAVALSAWAVRLRAARARREQLEALARNRAESSAPEVRLSRTPVPQTGTPNIPS